MKKTKTWLVIAFGILVVIILTLVQVSHSAQADSVPPCESSYLNVYPQDGVMVLPGENGMRTIAQVNLVGLDTSTTPRRFRIDLRRKDDINDDIADQPYIGALQSLPGGLEVAIVIDIAPEFVSRPISSTIADQPSYLFALVWESVLSELNLTGDPTSRDQVVVDIPALDGATLLRSPEISPTVPSVYSAAAIRHNESSTLYNYLVTQVPLIAEVQSEAASQRVTESVLKWLDNGSAQSPQLVVLVRWREDSIHNSEIMSRISTQQAKNRHPTSLIVLDLGQSDSSDQVVGSGLEVVSTSLMTIPEGVPYPNPFFNLSDWQSYRDNVNTDVAGLLREHVSAARSSMDARFKVDHEWPVLLSTDDLPEMVLHVETERSDGTIAICERKLKFPEDQERPGSSREIQLLRLLIVIASVLTCLSVLFVLAQWLPKMIDVMFQSRNSR